MRCNAHKISAYLKWPAESLPLCRPPEKKSGTFFEKIFFLFPEGRIFASASEREDG